MKKLIKVALVAVCMLFMGNFAKAQTKIGHVAFEDVVQLMPELKTVQTQMQAYQKQWTDQLQSLQEVYNKALKDYQAQDKTMTDAVRSTKVAELQDLQKRLEDQSNLARQQVEAKSAEYYKPLADKVRAAITTVAKEKGYTYVVNTSQTDLIVAPDADNLLVAVKAKLGLK